MAAKIKITFNLNKTSEYKGKNHSYEFILLDNVRTLANNIIGKTKTLKFEIPPIESERNDLIKLRHKIMSMTPEERKRLGINKSTLWYQKRNIINGKKIKIYSKIEAKVKR